MTSSALHRCFGVGGRVMQGLILPVVAVAFAVAPVVGQNFGARQFGRVREIFRHSAVLSSVLMLGITLVCQWRSEWFIEPRLLIRIQQKRGICKGRM